MIYYNWQECLRYYEKNDITDSENIKNTLETVAENCFEDKRIEQDLKGEKNE